MAYKDYKEFLKKSKFKSGYEYFKDVQKNKKSEFEVSVEDYCNEFINEDDEFLYRLASWEEDNSGDSSPFFINWMDDLYSSVLSRNELSFINPETLEEEKTLYYDRVDNLFNGEDFRITEFYEDYDEEFVDEDDEEEEDTNIIILNYSFSANLSDYYAAMIKAAEKVDDEAAYPPTFTMAYSFKEKDFYYPYPRYF